MTKMKCTKCESTMKVVTRTDQVPVAGVAFSVTWEVWECPKDGTWIVPPEVHREFDRRALRTIATQGPATGSTLKYLRGSMKMRAAELARAINVQPETLSRWENEAQPVNPLVWVTVAAMALDNLEGRATTTKRLRAAAAGEAPTEPIAIDLQGAA